MVAAAAMAPVGALDRPFRTMAERRAAGVGTADLPWVHHVFHHSIVSSSRRSSSAISGALAGPSSSSSGLR